MKRMWIGMGWAAGTAILLAASAVPASAQLMHPWTERGFVNVNLGFQTKARTATARGDQSLYDETATFEARIGVGNAPIVDIAGGWRLWRNLAGGIAFSRYTDSSDAALSASIPDPLFFDRPVQAALIVPGLDHVEVATHISAVWVMPITDKIDVSISAGPSIFSVRKDVISEIQVPFPTTTLAGASTRRVSETAVGGHVAFDAQYVLLENVGPFRTVGAGLFFRYASASLDVDELADSLEVGGLNYGIGARLRF